MKEVIVFELFEVEIVWCGFVFIMEGVRLMWLELWCFDLCFFFMLGMVDVFVGW